MFVWWCTQGGGGSRKNPLAFLGDVGSAKLRPAGVLKKRRNRKPTAPATPAAEEDQQRKQSLEHAEEEDGGQAASEPPACRDEGASTK